MSSQAKESQLNEVIAEIEAAFDGRGPRGWHCLSGLLLHPESMPCWRRGDGHSNECRIDEGSSA